jgi:hypothetical protein
MQTDEFPGAIAGEHRLLPVAFGCHQPNAFQRKRSDVNFGSEKVCMNLRCAYE